MLRRVFFLLSALLVLLVAAVWVLAPDLKTLRPDIEHFLKQELKLQELQLGELSWYWAGRLALTSEASSFFTSDGSVRVSGSRISVNMSVPDLLFGKLTPTGVRLDSGIVNVAISETSQPLEGQMPAKITLEDVALQWRYKGYTGALNHFTLNYDSHDRELMLHIPGSRLQLLLDAQMLPVYADVSFSDVAWLPPGLKELIRGDIAGRIVLDRPSPNQWVLNIELSSRKMASVILLKPNVNMPLSAFSGRMAVRVDANGDKITYIGLDVMELTAGESTLYATARWQQGRLELSASSPHVEMRHVWQMLKPLGDEAWHAWLDSMQHGFASEAGADLSMPWARPWMLAPTEKELDALQYRVNAHFAGADIGLALENEIITHAEGDVDMDEHGLKAMVNTSQLPHAVGEVSGHLHIPWQSMQIEVDGKGNVDAGRLHAWVDPEEASAISWVSAIAASEFSIRWVAEEDWPRAATIKLTPVSLWSLSIKDVPIEVDAGTVSWAWQKGLRFTDVHWSTPELDIHTNLSANVDTYGAWDITDLEASASGDLGVLTSHFLLPIESAGGPVQISLGYDGRWSGDIDLAAAQWSNFLGTSKQAGLPVNIQFRGVRHRRMGATVLVLEDIHCDAALLRLQGTGSVSQSGLQLNFEHVETASFSGGIAVRAPFGPEPWELDVNSSYLNRNALPASLERLADGREKSWVLRAGLDRFVWDDAEMKGVSLKLASALNSVAVLKAGSMRSGDVHFSNIRTIFSMPGRGVVDIRQFEAGLEDLQLKLSATLSPHSKRGMQWRGFAELTGIFGTMMSRAGFSSIFKDGDMHILFSGQGELFSDQPWWHGMNGRMRLRVDDGRVLKGGALSKFLAAASLADLPGFITGSRDDLTKPGLGYEHLQLEAVLQDKNIQIHKLAMRSSAMDIAGSGTMDADKATIDLTLVMRPLQNLDVILSKVPIIRDIFGGAAHSLMRRVYHMHGPITNADVDLITPKQAGLESPGLIETLLGLPEEWFGPAKKTAD